MKRMFKNGLAITLAAALLVPCFSASAAEITVPAASIVEETATVSLAGLEDARNYGHMDDGIESSGLVEELTAFSTLTGASKHSSKYDPRSGKLGYKLPTIRDQGSFGTCWAQALVGCMEISAIKNSKMSSSTNLSELELVSATYFHPGNDPVGLLKKDNYTTKFYIKKADMGGTTTWGINPLLNRVGLSLESSNSKLKYTPSNLNKYAYKKLDSKISYKKLSVDVHDYAILKNPTKDDIKSAIEKFGAVKVSYGAFAETTNMRNGAIYNPNNYGTNHDVVIVGWDDSYSRNNFRADNIYNGKPSKNGAWIIRNSWGTAGAGDKGYFYMSYEDKTACEFAFVEGVKASKDTYNKVYQYDSMPYNKTNYYNKVANTFTAKGSEKLGAVSFECVATKGNTYKVEIYTGSSSSNPTSGKKVATVSGKFKYTTECGNNYIKLSKPVTLKKGQKFTVVITTSGNSRVLYDDSMGIRFGSSSELAAELTKKPDNSTKNSFINTGYSWYTATCQHCIKAFTKKK